MKPLRAFVSALFPSLPQTGERVPKPAPECLSRGAGEGRGFALGFVGLLLASCAVQPVKQPAMPVDRAGAEAMDLRRGEVIDWNLAGRVAVSNGKQGGSGRIDWQNREDGYTLTLSAPITRQSWKLSGNALGARLEGIEGGPRESADVEQMLIEATGWDIPVDAMANWIRGIGAAGHEYGPTKVTYRPDGHPLQIEQAGWIIDYREWQTGPEPAMPTKLVATRGTAKIRLVVDVWTLGGGTP